MATTLSVGAASAATFTIDAFTAAQYAEDVPASGASNNDQLAAASAVGGFRDLHVINDDGRNQGTSAGANQFGLGLFGVSNAFLTSGRATLTYDGNDGSALESGVNTTGLASADLTYGGTTDRFAFDVLQANEDWDVDITVWEMSGASATVSFGIADNSTGVFETLFSAFGGIDMTDVGALQLTFTGVSASDLAIDDLRVTAPVPLPAGAFLLLGGLGALGFAKRRKTQG